MVRQGVGEESKVSKEESRLAKNHVRILRQDQYRQQSSETPGSHSGNGLG